MRTFHATISGLTCALTLVLTGAPAIAGHKHGGHYMHGSYGSHGGKPHVVHKHWRHPYCHAKMAKHGRIGKGWAYRGHHPSKMYRGKGKASHGYGHGAAYGYQQMKPGGDTYGKYVGYGGGHSVIGGFTAPAALPDLVETAVAAGNFSTLIAAAKAAGLADALKGAGPLTVLAPSDNAFEKLPKAQLDGLMKDPEALKGVLSFHVIAGELSAADLLEQGQAETLNGATVSLAQLDVAKADIRASNGIIHVLDAVLIPSE
jgi:hypothetical protein